jgi:hypothetical protein
MKVCFENIFDAITSHIGHFNVGLHFSQWVNDGRFSTTLNIVCTMRQTACIYLFYLHPILLFIAPVKQQNNEPI